MRDLAFMFSQRILAVWLALGLSTLSGFVVANEASVIVGEYTSIDDSIGHKSLGLQVTAGQDNSIRGMLFRGGLPGVGWDRSGPVELVGSVSQDVVRLEGGGFQVSIDRFPNRMPPLADKLPQATQLVSQVKLAKLSGSHAESSHANGNADRLYATLRTPDGQTYQLTKVARRGVSLGMKPPANAVVLFGDDRVPRHLLNAKVNDHGYLMVGTETDFPVHSFRLHVEYRTPFMPDKLGQARGNSGIYIQRRYEVQILDSFAFPTQKDGCGALYKQRPPDVNMAGVPGQWQSYDIFFDHARFDANGNKIRPAIISVIHNGVPVHLKQPIATKTGAGKVEGPEPMPILFQDHSDPVEYRNIWLVHGSPF